MLRHGVPGLVHLRRTHHVPPLHMQLLPVLAATCLSVKLLLFPASLAALYMYVKCGLRFCEMCCDVSKLVEYYTQPRLGIILYPPNWLGVVLNWLGTTPNPTVRRKSTQPAEYYTQPPG